ncbi:ABC transporter permease [Stenotrophomonas sp. ATCM1_4]|uniref:ABC transporter permease n=1 Tax=Stenotrophomonas sp. ATCM1_4 TaxID=2259330 RepID=UPI001FB642AF|nr:ABC transporter permease [Stenotrophomonas sp. ATCM1_4]
MNSILVRPWIALWQNRSLIRELAKRDILGRYRGASFGLAWSLISPFLMLMVYTFAFGTVMKGRWPEIEAGHTKFAIILFAGLIVHGFFAECLNKSVSLIVSNPNFVKRVIFPLEILPWPMVLSALFHSAMNLAVFMVMRLIMDGQLSMTTPLFFVVMLPLVVFCMGMSWFMAAIGVYFRDIWQVTGVLSMAMLFLSSAMMPVNSVPEKYRWVFELNPLTFIIDQARKVLLWGGYPDWVGLGWYSLMSVIIFCLGYWVFSATRRGFADVL